MKRLVLILVCVLLAACARAEFDAEIDTSEKGAKLLVRYVNDTSETVSGAEVWVGDTKVLALPDVKPGASWSGSAELAEYHDGAQVQLRYALQSETVSLPNDYSKVQLYIQLPQRALTAGETVKARLTLVNGGKTDVHNAVIKASNGFESDAFTLKAGEYVTYETDYKVSFPIKLTAQALHAGVEFASADAPSAEKAVKGITVSCVTVSKVQAGEPVQVTVNIENTGNVDYTAPVLREKTSGIVSGLPEVIKAGAFVTVNASLPALYADTELSFTFEGIAEDGSADTYASKTYPVTVAGTAAEIETRQLTAQPAGETSFVAEALLGIATLNGLPFITVCACAAVSAILLGYMIFKRFRRTGKRRKKA